MKLIIIDGHAFVFRAYFAFQTANLTNSITGKPSGAVFGFFKMLFKIINDFKPTHIAMPFDPGSKDLKFLKHTKLNENQCQKT